MHTCTHIYIYRHTDTSWFHTDISNSFIQIEDIESFSLISSTLNLFCLSSVPRILILKDTGDKGIRTFHKYSFALFYFTQNVSEIAVLIIPPSLWLLRSWKTNLLHILTAFSYFLIHDCAIFCYETCKEIGQCNLCSEKKSSL